MTEGVVAGLMREQCGFLQGLSRGPWGNGPKRN